MTSAPLTWAGSFSCWRMALSISLTLTPFNESLDEKVLKPTATVYSNVVPQPVRSGIVEAPGQFVEDDAGIIVFAESGLAALQMRIANDEQARVTGISHGCE